MNKEADEKKVIYVWSGGSCDECAALNGAEFESPMEAPGSLHPNCGCSLEEVVSTYSPSNEKDTVIAKEALALLGYYDIPEDGIDGYTDNEMYEGIKDFQKDNGLKVDGVVKPDGETLEKINEKIMDLANYFSKEGIDGLSAAGMQGLSLGWSDEIHGMLRGLGYGVGSLNKDWNKKGESFSKAFKRGYKEKRDEHRNLIKEGYKKNPIVATAMEAAGAIASPIRFTGASKRAPLGVKDRNNLFDAAIGGGVYGIGVSEGGLKDYAKNVGTSVAGSYLGRVLSNKIYGRGDANLIEKKITSYGTNLSVSNANNNLFDQKNEKIKK